MGWYESLFDGAEGHKAIGEATPLYTWAPENAAVPERIFRVLGDIKYIYIVRSPIERMISHYRHALYFRWIPDNTTFEAALELVPGLKNCSRYFYQIEQYLPYTTPQQWHVVVLEELIAHPNKFANEVFRFLGIDEIALAELPAKNVMDGKRRRRRPSARLDFLGPYFPSPLLRLGRRWSKRYGKRIPRPHIPEHVRSALARDLKPDVLKLSEFTGKDLESIWGTTA